MITARELLLRALWGAMLLSAWIVGFALLCPK
jgi:hypothetical protein